MTDLCSAWNPGLESDIPPAYRELETIYRPENTTTQMTDVAEISAETGLSCQELVAFRAERLVLHELIIRVTADIVVMEGSDETDLGRNFREIARLLFQRHIQPRMAEITRNYDQLHDTVYRRVRHELIEALFTGSTPPQQPGQGLFHRLWGRGRHRTQKPRETTGEREHRVINHFKERGMAAGDPLSAAIYRGLYRILGSIAGNRGYLGPNPDLLARLVCTHICNTYGSRMIGAAISPWLERGFSEEGCVLIRDAEKPLLISLKGASAAGKSSLRPMLKRMMSERGINPDGYATISPDIWRRLLLDYGSLGEAYKYAGRLTGNEVIIIDSKLDRYIRSKADHRGSMPNLLVDRFRFDSFSTERISRILHGTYVKHVDALYMYFVVTPPHATVERGWERGLQTGRYKSVEDFLDHSVEAYTGMPKVLFKWLAYHRPRFRYEFLDNSVPKGTYPKTIAIGTQHEINIFDCSLFVDIERYRKINIRARSPQEVYPTGAASAVANNTGFLKQCIDRIPTVNFSDPATGITYLRACDGKFTVTNHAVFRERLEDRERAEIFAEIAPQLLLEAVAGGK